MIELAKELKIDAKLIKKLKALTAKDIKKINKLKHLCSKSFSPLKKENDLIRLAVVLTLALDSRIRYKEKDIPDSIFLDTMSDIKIWCENNGNKGLKNYNWLKNHIYLELFRLGRLQFQLFECSSKALNYKKLPFEQGEKVIYIHIPQGEKLIKEKCTESISMADIFFRKYFPSHEYRYYFTESWLLFDGNRNFMAPESNILDFSSLYTHCYSVKIDVQAIDRIFGKRRLFKKSYPESTSLQKRAKQYMLKGGRLGVGIAVINKSNFS